MNLESFPDLLHIILLKVGPKDTARVACVSRSFRNFASDEYLWSIFCEEDLDLHEPLDPHGNPAPSFKATYWIWRESFNMYPWSLVKRVKRCWDRLKKFLAINFPAAKATLKRGASEADIQELENVLEVKLPIPTRIIYRFCDGQACAEKASEHPVGLGLIGGYRVYGHLINVYLLPLSRVILDTKRITGNTGYPSACKFILVAASLTSCHKLFFLNCTTGQLYVGTEDLLWDGVLIPCVPRGLIMLENEFNSDQCQDAMLLWLEEHGRKLQNGIIKIREEGNIRSISLFPENPPLCSTAVTRGVKVRASSLFVPEKIVRRYNSFKFMFAYSIRMSLQPEGCIINRMTFSSCRLQRRHWIISSNNNVVTEVNGEAVIREYPLLRPGEPEFVYESFAPLPVSSASMRGSFTFVPGSLLDQEGGPFEVEVAEFPLCIPDYIF